MTYAKPTISNYNDDAPIDDGSATVANKVKWSKVKDELSDPLKNYADAINNAVESAFLQLLFSDHDIKTTTFTPSATTDDGKLFVCTAALTCNLPVAADATEGYTIGILNLSAGTITADGNAAELINGAATYTTTADYELVILLCTGTAWYAAKIASSNSPVTVKDSLFTIQDNSDTTKQVQFQASGVTTATTRTLTVPDANTTIVGTDATQTLSNKTLASTTTFPSGVTVARSYAEYLANANLATAIPYDDTTPLITEGVEILSVSHTAKTTTNKLNISFSGMFSGDGSASTGSAAIFAGTTCIGSVGVFNTSTGAATMMSLNIQHTPATTSAVTYTVRAGPNAGNIRFNGTSTARIFGGSAKTTITIDEVVAS